MLSSIASGADLVECWHGDGSSWVHRSGAALSHYDISYHTYEHRQKLAEHP